MPSAQSAPVPWRARLAEQVLAGQPATAEWFGRAADAELAAAAPLRDNAFKVTLARNIMVRMLCVLAGVPAGDDRVTGRVDGPDKVTGRARYAFEHPVDGAADVWAVPSVIAKGLIRSVDASAALALPGVLAVITPDNAPRLAWDRRSGAGRVPVPGGRLPRAVRGRGGRGHARDGEGGGGPGQRSSTSRRAHDVTLTQDHPGLYKPDYVNPRYETDTAVGDFDGAFAAAAVRVDATYRTPAEHNHPMEPHATIAAWQGDTLTLYDATQGPSRAAAQIAAVFGLEPGGVRVIAEHVGGGFGAKGMPRANVVLAAMAARVSAGRSSARSPGQQMFAVTGHRAPSIQRVRLGAGPDGRLVAPVPRRLRPDLHAQGVHRAVGGGHQAHVRRAAPPDH